MGAPLCELDAVAGKRHAQDAIVVADGVEHDIAEEVVGEDHAPVVEDRVARCGLDGGRGRVVGVISRTTARTTDASTPSPRGSRGLLLLDSSPRHDGRAPPQLTLLPLCR